MIFSAARYHERAVDLFEQHHARELMRECHFRHRELEVRAALDLVSQPVRAADNKNKVSAPADCRLLNIAAEFFRRELLALNAHRVNARRLVNELQNALSLVRESRVYLRLRRVVRDTCVGQLRYFQLAERRKAL